MCLFEFNIMKISFQVILNLMHNWIIIDQKTNKVYGNKESNKFVNKFFKPSNYKVFASVSYNGSLFSFISYYKCRK